MYAPMHAPMVVVPRKQSNAGCVVGLVAVMAVLMIAGAAFWMLFATRSATNVSATERARDKPPQPVVAPIPSQPPKSKVDYFASPESAGTAIAARFTQNAELRELVIYRDYVIFELRDASQRNNVDRHTLREGIDEGDPVQLSGRDKARLDGVTFRLSEVRFALVPGLISDAKTRIPIPEGKVTHIIIDESFGASLGFRVYVTSQREDGGYVSYDASGKMRRVVD